MMMFNMEVASRGIQKSVAYFTGLFNIAPDTYERYSFLGTKRQPHHKLVRKNSDTNCHFCAKDGIYLGAGDSLSILVHYMKEDA